MHRISLLLAGFFLVGCAQVAPKSSTPNDRDSAFTKLADEYLAGYLSWRPQTGTALGLHQYDGKLTDFSRASLDAELKRLQQFDRELAALNASSLSARGSCDLRILQAAIKNERFKFEQMESYTKNPMSYADVLDVNIYIKRNFAPLEQRVRSIIAIEEQAPKVMEAARRNLAGSLAKPFVETAIEVAKGAADFLSKDLVEALKGLK